MATEPDENEGQLSEVASRKTAGQVTPGDAVAGHPTDRNVQEGAAGPNARTGDEPIASQETDEDYDVSDPDPEAIVDEEQAPTNPETSEEADQDQYPHVQDVEEDRA